MTHDNVKNNKEEEEQQQQQQQQTEDETPDIALTASQQQPTAESSPDETNDDISLQDEEDDAMRRPHSAFWWTSAKLLASAVLLYLAGTATTAKKPGVLDNHYLWSSFVATPESNSVAAVDESDWSRRRLSEAVVLDSIAHPPPYMDHLMKDLQARQKLFDETPPEEVKYWFEYTGPLQVRMERDKE